MDGYSAGLITLVHVSSQIKYHDVTLYFPGVRKWMDKSSKAIKRQDMISVKAWVKGMDTRIQSLGGEGVERFLANLFKAFDGLFENSNIPPKKAGKALSVVQRIKHMKKVR